MNSLWISPISQLRDPFCGSSSGVSLKLAVLSKALQDGHIWPQFCGQFLWLCHTLSYFVHGFPKMTMIPCEQPKQLMVRQRSSRAFKASACRCARVIILPECGKRLADLTSTSTTTIRSLAQWPRPTVESTSWVVQRCQSGFNRSDPTEQLSTVLPPKKLRRITNRLSQM